MVAPKHIVVAEDDADVRSILAAILRDAGYRVSTAGNGEAVRAIVARRDRIDLVVLDAVMPGERSRTLSAHLGDLRIFVVAMSDNPGAMRSAGKQGLQMLEKPFRAAALEEAVDAAFASGKYGQRMALPAGDRQLTDRDDDPTEAGRPALIAAPGAPRRRRLGQGRGRSGDVPRGQRRGVKSNSR